MCLKGPGLLCVQRSWFAELARRLARASARRTALSSSSTSAASAANAGTWPPSSAVARHTSAQNATRKAGETRCLDAYTPQRLASTHLISGEHIKCCTSPLLFYTRSREVNQHASRGCRGATAQPCDRSTCMFGGKHPPGAINGKDGEPPLSFGRTAATSPLAHLYSSVVSDRRGAHCVPFHFCRVFAWLRALPQPEGPVTAACSCHLREGAQAVCYLYCEKKMTATNRKKGLHPPLSTNVRP